MCIVLTDPEHAGGRQVLYVPIITARGKFDHTCISKKGDHRFIGHTSSVHYAMMGQRAEAHLLKVGNVDEPFRPDFLERVLEGAKKSPYSPPGRNGSLPANNATLATGRNSPRFVDGAATSAPTMERQGQAFRSDALEALLRG